MYKTWPAHCSMSTCGTQWVLESQLNQYNEHLKEKHSYFHMGVSVYICSIRAIVQLSVEGN